MSAYGQNRLSIVGWERVDILFLAVESDKVFWKKYYLTWALKYRWIWCMQRLLMDNFHKVMFHIGHRWVLQGIYVIFLVKKYLHMGEWKHQEAKKFFMVMETKSQLSSCVLFSDPISSLSIGPGEVSVDTKSNSMLHFPIRVLQDLERL